MAFALVLRADPRLERFLVFGAPRVTACFDAEYVPCNGTARSDTMLPMLMSTPPLRRMKRTAVRQPCTTPQKFVSKSRR